MALKLKISYESDSEIPSLLTALKTLFPDAKIVYEPPKGRFKRLYITPKNPPSTTK